MRTFIKILLLVGWLLFSRHGIATAQISEVRIGIGEFSEDIINPRTERNNGIENSVALQGEVIFDEPGFLKWALTPQPYINGSLNLEGNTNHAGAGLLWRQSIGKRIYGDFGLGGVIHDGTIEHDLNDFIDGNAIDLEAFYSARNTEREFGSRVLIRAQLTMGFRVDQDWATEVFFEHLSNGEHIRRDLENDTDILNYKPNDAADTLGIRVARRF